MTVSIRGSEIYRYPSHMVLTAMKKNTLHGVTWHNNLVSENYDKENLIMKAFLIKIYN
jgi:hypothetical protein